MGKLFWRIFLGLWLGSAALMIGTSAAIAVSAERPRFNFVRSQFALATRTTARSVLETSTKEEAARQLNELQRSNGTTLYLFDRNGHELLGRTLPPELSHFGAGVGANRDRVMSGEPMPGGRLALSELVSDETGERYRAVATFRGPPRPRLDRLLKRNAGPILLSVLIAGLISALVARHLVNPISKLRAAAGRLASGDLDYRVAHALLARNDEFTALAHDFDRMAARIGSLIGAQRQLMLDLSHELRSPLARLRVALELARGPNTHQDLLDRMVRDTDRMDILIGELLLLARLESPEGRPLTAPLDMDELITDVVEDARLEAASSGHKLSYRAEAGLTVVDGNQELLRRAIENIVRNALQHTPAGTEVEVLLRREAQTVEVRIADRGPGVSTEMIERLFRPFARGDAACQGGNGLGLAIARGAVQQHGGQIMAAARKDGPGLVITVRLPASSSGPIMQA